MKPQSLVKAIRKFALDAVARTDTGSKSNYGRIESPFFGPALLNCRPHFDFGVLGNPYGGSASRLCVLLTELVKS